MARGRAMVTEAAAVLDLHLAEREWICGTGLTLADFAIAAPLAVQWRAALPVLDRPNLQRWFERVRRPLPAWRQAIGDGVE
ncbi:MAG: glutathione binding-like protein [Burkholderiaceae bacterium]